MKKRSRDTPTSNLTDCWDLGMNGGGESNVKFSVIKPGSMMVNINLVIGRSLSWGSVTLREETSR